MLACLQTTNPEVQTQSLLRFGRQAVQTSKAHTRRTFGALRQWSPLPLAAILAALCVAATGRQWSVEQ